MLLRIPHEIREDDLHTTTIRCGETRAIGIIDVLQAHTLICGNTTLLFAKDENVLFTHNRAERDLHMSQVKQKTSGCFRKPQYAEVYCPISSNQPGMAECDYDPLIAIQLALSGEPYVEPREVLLGMS